MPEQFENPHNIIIPPPPPPTPPPIRARQLFPGSFYGELKLLRRVRAGVRVRANLRKRWKVQCSCNKVEIVPEHYLKRSNPKWHCGCKDKTVKTLYPQEYGIWIMMHQRCYNPDHNSYPYYGAKGVGIEDVWNKNKTDSMKAFTHFICHIGPRPSPGHSVDRINVYGNYGPGNVRWATAIEQAANKRV